MRESSTYQAILAEGRAQAFAEARAQGRIEEPRRILVLWGEKFLGAPDAATRATIEAVTDLGRLERLVYLADEASDWTDLLARP